MLRRRGWLAGCLSVTRAYCIKTAKPILKLVRPSGASGSPITLVSSDTCADTQFQGEPLQRGEEGALNTQGVGKLAIFGGNRHLSRKWCEIRPMVER